ncbi:interleukin-1 beta [Micropterus salmoides]|uniref:interleukin-1 beta n=1 Tax=Micropterus salmoides TaxID=27706 RepID=UPI0018ECED67|nr:interleukin-1 beta [Micropterus salmoides]
MCDFDLRDALETSPDVGDSGFESCCFDMTEVQDEIFKLDEGLDLVVSRNPMTVQCVANLVVAINRMKKPLTNYSRQLSGEELCSMIMDSLVDETAVEECCSERKKTYIRANSVKTITLSDRSKKDIIYNSVAFKLQAITLQGGHSTHKVNFKLSRYIDYPVCESNSSPVVLSITNLYMSCSMEGGKAVLKLEQCSEEELKSIDCEKMKRFLFLKRNDATNFTTFESLSCPKWFISTYEEENQPLEMSNVDITKCYFSVN